VLLERKDANTVLDWQLLPCPFCGIAPTVDYNPQHGCAIGCRNTACHVDATVWDTDPEQAVLHWNTRYTPQPAAA
jgi:hypothetical protein